MATSSSSSSFEPSYEEQKKKSILEFCQEDTDNDCDFPVPLDEWESGKKDFATRVYEKEEKANDGAAGPILPRSLLKVLWIVELLRRQKDKHCKLIPSPTLLKRPTDALPSIISNIEQIGTFPTEHWMEGFDNSPDDSVFWLIWGEEYRVVDFDMTVADGSVMKLNAVVNLGDADANTGYWGGVFVRDSTKMVATINSWGDTCTIIEEVKSNLGAFVPFSECDLDFLTSYFENSEYREEEETSDYHIFGENLSPGICNTQFEKIMGMVMDRFMQ